MWSSIVSHTQLTEEHIVSTTIRYGGVNSKIAYGLTSDNSLIMVLGGGLRLDFVNSKSSERKFSN